MTSTDAIESIESIVTPQWLYEHLHDPDVVVADCQFSLGATQMGKQHYETAHIPGAYYLDLNQTLSSPVAEHGGRHPLPDLAILSQRFSDMGLDSSQSHSSPIVVAYDDSRMAFASRLWWLLRYLGYDRVVVLKGGLSAWRQAGYPLTQAIPENKSGRFVAQPQAGWVVDVGQVQAAIARPGVVLVDSREAIRYRGEQEPIDPVAGHIPGAVNYPWQEVTDDHGRVRSPQIQQERWAAVRDADEIIVYCGSGVTACVNLLSLHLAGISTGKLYAGSWSDWCSYPDLPIQTGEQP